MLTVTTFATARPAGATVQDRLRAAVTAYYQDRRALPAGIVVSPGELDAAKAAAVTLGLKIPVGGMGGCLVPEIWLEVPDVP